MTDKPTERDWDGLSLDEKLTELGFPGHADAAADFALLPKSTTTRLHGALDQLLDAGGLLGEIEAMTTGAGTGSPTGDELNTCAAIYELITQEESDEEEEPEDGPEEPAPVKV